MVLEFKLESKEKTGFLAINWYDGTQLIGSDSMYIDQPLVQDKFELLAPKPAAYRVILSLNGQALRQVELYEVKP